ncbi:protein misato homolog 1 isoform X2 [Eublepharis macularius]|uniref:Protein misato homolog 1 n=1 Tax=Eublepharis macularius TaxID=481883 RepID=A0AA97KXQ6_EUBMA|nr:protein misato homolog 1 isoform X2 [Eublepharis macularius]
MWGPREVVTLQLGHYAGSVGAHWWGLQEASFCTDPVDKKSNEGIRHDVLFRAGETLQGQETYTPRLIVMDLKGSLSSLKQEGCLYQDTKTNTPVAWKGKLTAHQEETSPKNPFLKDLNRSQGGTSPSGNFAPRTPHGGKDRTLLLEGQDKASKEPNMESTMHVWSDFLRTHLHPRSILTIHQYNHEGESSRLEAFGQGEKLLQDPTYLEELEDRLHFYVEECDYLQGFQVLCDLHNGFSGVGAKVTELLQDEYTGKGILTWGLTPVHSVPNPQLSFYRLMNTVLGLVHLSSHSSLFCPLSLNGRLGLRPEPPVALPYVHYDASLDYHTSAILATALDTCTVPYRLQASTISMAHLAEALNFSGRKVATAVTAVPFPVAPSQSLPDALCAHQSGLPWSPLSSCGEQRGIRCFAQSAVLRGIAKEHLVSKPPPGCEPKSVLHMSETGEEVLARYLYTVSPTTLSTVHLLQSPCQLLAPYPQYFSPLLDKQGFLLDAPARASATLPLNRKTPASISISSFHPPDVESIPVIAALQSSAVLHGTLGAFYKELRHLDVRRWASFFSAGVELDDFQEALEELRTLSQCYRESGSEEESEEEVD